jgi:tetratricopeptide (TPR) repeat protein
VPARPTPRPSGTRRTPGEAADPAAAAARRVASLLGEQTEPGRGAVLALEARDQPWMWHAAAVLPVYVEQEGLRCLSRRALVEAMRGAALSPWPRLSRGALAHLARQASLGWWLELYGDPKGIRAVLVKAGTAPQPLDEWVIAVGPKTDQTIAPFGPVEAVDAVLIDWTAVLRATEARQGLELARTMVEGDLLFDMGRWAEAAARYESASENEYLPARLLALLSLTHVPEACDEARRDADDLADEPGAPRSLALALKATAMVRDGDRAGAEAILREIAPGSARAVLLYNALCDTPEALALLEAAAQREVGAPVCTLALAENRLRNGRIEECIELARRALRVDPDAALAQALLASAQIARGDAAAAEKAAGRALELDVTLTAAYETLAQVLWMRRDYSEALRTLQTGTRNAPWSEMLWIRLGDLQMRLRLLKPARRSFGAALRLKPELSYARLRLAELLLEEGRHAQALAELDRGDEDEQSVRWEILRARALSGQGRHDRAIRVLRAAARRPEGEIEARIALSRTLEATEDGKAALAEAQMAANRAVQTRSSLAAAAFARVAEAALVLGQIEDADGASAEALKRNPGSTPVMLARVRVLMARENWDEARALARDMREREPFSPRPYELLGDIAAARGLERRAVSLWQTALTLEPGSDELTWKIAELCRTSGQDPVLARLYYELCARAGGPHSDQARRALRQIRTDGGDRS